MGIGGIVGPRGSESRTSRPVAKKVARRTSILAWATILAGATMVGTGGTLTTMGWEMRSTQSQRDATLRCVIQENARNMQVLIDRKFTATDSVYLDSFVVYSRMVTSGMTSLLTGGAFTYSSDLELTSMVTVVRDRLESLNRGVDLRRCIRHYIQKKHGSFERRSREAATICARRWPAQPLIEEESRCSRTYTSHE